MMRAWSRYGAMLALLVLSAPGFAQAWWDGGGEGAFSHRVRGYIDATYVDEEIPVVPMWVPSTATAWFGAVQADGDDVRVVADDGTVLDYYLVAINTGTPVCMLLVNVTPVISTTVDGYLSIYAGNALATAASSSSAVFAGTDYVAYWMPGMWDDDLTGGGFDLIGMNWSRSTDVAASDWDGLTAATLNGSNQYFWHANAPVITEPVSLEALAYITNTTASNVPIALGDSSDATAVLLNGAGGASGDPFRLQVRGTAGTFPVANAAAYTGSQWLYGAGTFKTSGGASLIAYLDGVAGTENTTGPSSSIDPDRISIGTWLSAGTPTASMTGNVAQAAVSSVVRSADFVATNYDAWFQSDFITWGSVEEAPSGGAGHPWFYMRRN